MNKGRKSSKKKNFFKNVKILLKAIEDSLNRFESYIFPINKMPDTTPYITPDTTPYITNVVTSIHERSELSRLNENFISKIKNDGKT